MENYLDQKSTFFFQLSVVLSLLEMRTVLSSIDKKPSRITYVKLQLSKADATDRRTLLS